VVPYCVRVFNPETNQQEELHLEVRDVVSSRLNDLLWYLETHKLAVPNIKLTMATLHQELQKHDRYQGTNKRGLGSQFSESPFEAETKPSAV